MNNKMYKNFITTSCCSKTAYIVLPIFFSRTLSEGYIVTPVADNNVLYFSTFFRWATDSSVYEWVIELFI